MSRQRVVVQPEERQAPEPVRPERTLRLQVEEERLQLVEAVERGERAGKGARRGPEDRRHPVPERALVEPLQEAQLHHHAVDAAAREDDADVPPFGHAPRVRSAVA
jgi:GAF domain-containing protein